MGYGTGYNEERKVRVVFGFPCVAQPLATTTQSAKWADSSPDKGGRGMEGKRGNWQWLAQCA